MSKAITLTILLAATLCIAHAQKITGEGAIVEKEISVSDFTGVSLGFSGDIYLTQGSAYKVVVKAQQNIIDNIKRNVKDGVWHVGFEKNVRSHKGVKVYITMPTLDHASVGGSGSIISESKFTGLGDLKAAVSGSGNVKLDVEADEIRGGISGSGKVALKGQASRLDMDISGSGDIDAKDLRVQSCDISISGSGDAVVWATEELDAAISGSGDIRYKGDAAKVRARVSGSGDVRELSDSRQ